MSKVSVIIPAYNCGIYLDEAVKSVLNQSYKNIEILVIDDGSSDDTPRVMKKYLSDPRFKYIRKPERKGTASARNTGITAASGDFITYLDADDVFLKNKVARQVEFLEKRKEPCVSYTNEIYFENRSGREIISDRFRFSGDVLYYLKRSNFITICAVMARSSVFKENRFDEDLRVMGHEDWELFLRLALKGFRFHYMDEPLVKIRIRPGSTTASDNMDNSRSAVGLKAKEYWRGFKRSMNPFSLNGQRAVLRYLKFRANAFVIGFPEKERFNRPVNWKLTERPA